MESKRPPRKDKSEFSKPDLAEDSGKITLQIPPEDLSKSFVMDDKFNKAMPEINTDAFTQETNEVLTILSLLRTLEKGLEGTQKKKVIDELITWVRLMGAGGLGSQGAEFERAKATIDKRPAVRDEFITLLDSTSSETRSWAASFIEQLFDKNTAIESILRALSSESDGMAASWMALSLSRLEAGNLKICGSIADAYKRFVGEFNINIQIARAWGYAGCQEAAPVLVKHLSDGGYDQKIVALDGLISLRTIEDLSIQPMITQVMLSTKWKDISDKCIDILKRFPSISSESLALISDAANDDVDEQRNSNARKAVRALSISIGPISKKPSFTLSDADEYVSRFNSDVPVGDSVVDCINVESEARAFAKIAAAKEVHPPLAIGIFGEWGSGKTFFMERIYANIIDLAGPKSEDQIKSPFCKRVVQIRFNAWHYMESNLWASLVDYIFQELDIWLHSEKEDKKNIDALFDRLSTARQLKLESVQAYIGARKERERAASRLDDARKAYESALERRPVYSAKAFWGSVLSTFKGKLEKEDKEKLEQASNELGIPQLVKSAENLNATIEEAANQAGRAKVLFSATISQLGQGRALAALISSLLLIPLGLVLIRALLASTDTFSWMETINDLTIGLGGILAATAAVVGKVFKRAASALNILQTFQDRLNRSIDEEKERPKQEIAEAQREVEATQNEVEQAEKNLGNADKRVEAAVKEWKDATPRGRLSRFIREKVVGGEYAKHLGIIAAIRKDFGQLAQMVSEQSADETSQQLYKKAQQEYQAEVARLITEASDILTKSDIKELEDSANKELPRVPSFERIILYIDDLDRCPPDKVVSVLQAIHLLLCFKLFVVVVAVDARWISRALIKEYPDLIEENVMWIEPNQLKNKKANSGHTREGASSHDYLEKIFQIPYWVRPMDSESCMKYVVHLTSNDLLQANDEEPDITQSPADIKKGAKGNEPQPEVEVTDVDDEALSTLEDETPSSPKDSGNESDTNEPDDSPPDKGEETKKKDHVYAGMSITDYEVEMLKHMAQYAGSSPRRSLRFINVYRLIKSGLDKKQLELLVGDNGQSLNYKAIITQLAISTGAPKIAQSYFRTINNRDDQITSLDALNERLREHPHITLSPEWRNLSGALAKLKALSQEKELDIDSDIILALRETAPIARRYSFTARPA